MFSLNTLSKKVNAKLQLTDSVWFYNESGHTLKHKCKKGVQHDPLAATGKCITMMATIHTQCVKFHI
jgi:hypothetical protein